MKMKSLRSLEVEHLQQREGPKERSQIRGAGGRQATLTLLSHSDHGMLRCYAAKSIKAEHALAMRLVLRKLDKPKETSEETTLPRAGIDNFARWW
jgi:hypothetical protein